MERPKGYSASIRPNGYMDNKPWPKGTRKWSVTLFNRNTGKSYSFQYHTGPAVKAKPEFKDVMEAAIQDTAFYDDYSEFPQFALESGWDIEEPEERREAQKVFKACRTRSEKMHDLLGDDFDDMAQYVAE